MESPVRRNETKKRQTPPATVAAPAGPTCSSPPPSVASTSAPPPVAIAKLPIPRLNSNSTASSNKVGTNYILISPPQPKPGQRKKYKLIQPKPDPPSNGNEEARFFTEPAPAILESIPPTPVSISSLEKDTLDDYLHGGNSQEQEEELMLYFQQSAASPPTPAPQQPPANIPAPEEPAKISQLRLLLERNLTKDATNTQNTRRRVSFETTALDPVPPSPNTRRRIFSFTPISPDAAPGNTGHPPPPSPAAPPRNSVTSSASASPFVSPRNTPVPRSRHNSGQQFVFPPGPSRTRHCSSGGISQRGTTQLTRPRHFSGTSVSRTYTTVPQMYDEAQFAEPTSAPHSPMIAPTGLPEMSSVQAHQRHRHVSAGPHLHMQIPAAIVDPLAQEVSALLSEPLPAMPQFRSQSVPLHQMAGRFAGPLGSGSNSVAATPVPSEFADFLESEPFDSIACEQLNQLFMDSEDVILEPARNFSSRSYPNTPVAELGGPALSGLPIPEASSRSYPSTPVEPDPLMAHLTLNAINNSINQGSTLGGLGARRNLADLLDQTPSFSADQGTFSGEQVGFVAVGSEASAFVPAPEQPSYLMDDFDQSELSQLVQEVEGSSQLSQEGTLE